MEQLPHSNTPHHQSLNLPTLQPDSSPKTNYFSARPLLNKTETKEVTYENRIFNIKKKFTVPNPHTDFSPEKKITIINDQKMHLKPPEVFTKYNDNVVKHRRLLRRGVWEVPFEPDTVLETKRPRYKTEHQEYSPKNSKPEQMQGLYHSTEQKRKKTQSTRNLQGWENGQLPALRNSHEIALPIRLSTRYGSKPISCKTTEADSDTQARHALTRKLAVEIINYNLLGKWACSSFKI